MSWSVRPELGAPSTMLSRATQLWSSISALSRPSAWCLAAPAGTSRPAMRVSNAVALAMLFGTGYAFGRCAGRQPWLTGIGMVGLGGVLVGLTIALGG